MPVIQFKGKTAIESYHHTIPHHTLEFDPKLSVLPKGEKPSLDGNLIIEGDNLLALKALLPTHAGRIKCIYIDPPYNTGNEGWVYNDNLTQPQFKEWIGKTVGKEGEDFTRHDKWCCMMYPRLQLLKDLLKKDGAIFVTIGDDEFANLRSVMDEVFGAENFVATFAWQAKDTPGNDSSEVATTHNYVLLYGRSQDFTVALRERTEKQIKNYKNPDKDPRGPWLPIPLTRGEYRERDYYALTNPAGEKVWPPEGNSWRRPPDRIKLLEKDNRLWWGRGGKSKFPFIKKFLSEMKEGVVPITWWPYGFAGSTRNARAELKEIFEGERGFETPKPRLLLTRILELSTEEDDLVLDSFAGSGTTAHAVLEMNSEGGNRNFILIQQPFETKEQEQQNYDICERVTSERVRRVITGYKFNGTKDHVVFEQRLSLKSLKNSTELLALLNSKKEENAKEYDSLRVEFSDGLVRLIGKKSFEAKTDGLGGNFTYARLASPLFGEYREFARTLPPFEELAKYIFYTETSRDFDKKALNAKTGKIGEFERRATTFSTRRTTNRTKRSICSG
jgi:adenine-specific DNA-methyltransferase